ncbi:MAG: glycosyltransferase [Proteobacteria bacterium]|nr:glycosyltransferase [Pseudomonadota bacterium]
MSVTSAVDVIILSWNRVDDTIAAIKSAASQTGVDSRIYIVDQGSEPACLEQLDALVAGLPNARLQKLPANSGVAGGRNIATAMGTAPFVVALDSDAVFEDERTLARAVAHLERDPDLCAIGFHIKNFFTGGNDDTSWDYAGRSSPDSRFAATRFIGAGHAIRRAAFQAVGGYDERLFFCGEELDLSYRMLNLGMRIDYCPDVAVLHKVSPQHRVFWDRGRFYYTARNALYSLYKFGAPRSRLLLAALSFLLKGARNGIAGQAVRAIGASIRLSREFARSPQNEQHYRLSAATREYIDRCEISRQQSVATKLRRLLSPLPHQSRG